MSLDCIFALRLDAQTQNQIEQIALQNGVSASALVRNSVKLALCPKEQPSLLETIIEKAKRERREQIFGKQSEKVKENGNNET